MSLHHIIDPRSGSSPEHTSGVSVVAPTAMAADALSTAALVLGPVEGMELLDRLDGVEGMIVTKDQIAHRSRGLSRYT
jgi:thiamine biosynthesis lipoprotein